MAFEINISGEIIPFNYWEMKGYVNLEDVENQLAEANGKDIIVNINSIGGDVEEGFMIYTALRKYAKDNNAKVTTYAKGRCFSIATVIFLAGDERIANKFIEPFVHNAWTYAMGDAKELIRTAADLEAVNEKIGNFYAEHTDLTYEEARELMDNDTFISPDEAVRIRFATSIEEVLRPVALNKIFNKKSKTITMAKKDEKGLFEALNKFFGGSGKPQNKVLFTSTSEEIVFPDLEDDDVAKVGDKATIDGKPAEGEVTISDGTVYVFEGGVLKEIRESETDEEDNSELEELRAENASLKEQIAALNKKVDNVVKAQKETQNKWNNLSKTISDYVVETKDNEVKTNQEGGKKGRLASAISNLKK